MRNIFVVRQKTIIVNFSDFFKQDEENEGSEE